jgi:hypothetical protein
VSGELHLWRCHAGPGFAWISWTAVSAKGSTAIDHLSNKILPQCSRIGIERSADPCAHQCGPLAPQSTRDRQCVRGWMANVDTTMPPARKRKRYSIRFLDAEAQVADADMNFL